VHSRHHGSQLLSQDLAEARGEHGSCLNWKLFTNFGENPNWPSQTRMQSWKRNTNDLMDDR
jgi:hypothetical protein